MKGFTAIFENLTEIYIILNLKIRGVMGQFEIPHFSEIHMKPFIKFCTRSFKIAPYRHFWMYLQNSFYGKISKIIQNLFKTAKNHINSYSNPRRFDVLTISAFLRTSQSLVGCQKFSALFYSVWKIPYWIKQGWNFMTSHQTLRGAQKCANCQNTKPSRI